jgi:hypothetical protein
MAGIANLIILDIVGGFNVVLEDVTGSPTTEVAVKRSGTAST